MAATIGALRVTLGANTAQFEAGMRRAAGTARTTAGSIQRSLGGLRSTLSGLAGPIAALFSVAAIRSGLEYASSLQEVATQLGVTARDLQLYRYVASQVGIEQEVMDKGLQKLTRSIGEAAHGVGNAGQMFRRLGIDVRDANGNIRSAGDVIPELANAISRIPDAASRATALTRIFGRTGQQLAPLFEQGAAGIQEFTRRAEELGLVLSDSEIARADETADKISELSQSLRVNFARIVAENAGSILMLAQSLGSLATGILRFLSSNPALAIGLIGALAGSRFGPAGAAIGGGIGMLGGSEMGREARRVERQTSMDVDVRRSEYQEALRAQRGEGGLFRSAISSQPARNERVARERTLYRQARQQAVRGVLGGGAAAAGIDIGNLGGGGGGRRGGADDAERQRKEALRNAHEHDQELRRLRVDELQALQQQTEDAERRLNLGQQIAEEEEAQWREDIDLKLALGDITKARYDELIALRGSLAAVLEAGREQERRVMIEERTNALAEQRYELAAEGLRHQSAMADTAAERRRIELQLLELSQEERRRKLLQIVSDSQRRIEIAQQAEAGASVGAYAGSAAGRRDRAAIDRAREELMGLRGRDEQERAGVMRSTMGPLETFLNTLPDTAAKVNEALQNIAAEGLSSITDGLADAIMMTRSWGDVAHAVVRQIISDLLKIQLQRSIIGPLTSALSGLLGGGTGMSSGNMWGSIVRLPGRASGGPVIPGHAYMVGEKGPEILRMGSMGGQVIANDNIGGGGVVINQTFAPNFAGNAATKQEMIQLAAMVKPMAQEAYRDMARRSG